jgi:hypothetical protein
VTEARELGVDNGCRISAFADFRQVWLAPDDIAKHSKVKEKLEIIGDYADIEKVRDVLKQLSPR